MTPRRPLAFTLLETLMSFTLLGLVVLFVVNLFPSSMATVRKSEQRFQAETMATSVLEQNAAAAFPLPAVATDQDLAPQVVDQITYHLHLSITKVPGEPRRFLRSFRVTVSWTYGGQTLQVVRELWVHQLASGA